jgi:hypothetical protein
MVYLHTNFKNHSSSDFLITAKTPKHRLKCTLHAAVALVESHLQYYVKSVHVWFLMT